MPLLATLPRAFAALALLLPLALPAAAQEEPSLDAVDAVVEPVVGRDTPGLAVLVMRGGEVLHMRGYGYADIERETLVDAHSVFDLASLSKQMTGLALKLEEVDGKLAPDDEVGSLLAPFADSDTGERALTVADLAHHVSGLTDYLADDAEGLDYGEETTNAEVMGWLAEQPLDRAPGTEFDYSNSGYLTLGSLVAAADGANSLRAVLAARVWEPLGMEETGLVRPASGTRDQVVTGYKGEDGDFEPSVSPTVTEGDGNVLTSIADLALYEKALADHELLDEAATAELFTNGTLDDGLPIEAEGKGGDVGYGYGWFLAPADGSEYAYHSGSWMGTSTYYQRNLSTGVTVVILANGEDLECGDLAERIEEAVR